METNRKIIEINGVKFDIDLSSAKRIEEFRIGDKVKVLKKGYSDYKVLPGVIIGFDHFLALPTISIAYLTEEYSSCAISILAYNAETKDVEICASTNEADLTINKEKVLNYFAKEISKRELEIHNFCQQRDYFNNQFGNFFHDEKENSLH